MKKNLHAVFLSTRKLIESFRFTRLLLLVAGLGLLQLTAKASYSQEVSINLDLENATLTKLIDEVQRQSEFTFFYSPEDIKGVNKLNISVKDARLEDVLDECFEGTGLEYEIKHKAIVLKKGNKEDIAVVVNRASSTQQEQKTVSGKVVDNEGLPMPGVTVLIKGSSIATVTDIEGEFSLKIPENASSLVFSFIGMKTKEVEIGSQTHIKVSMEQDAVGLEEVVAVGYGTMRRSLVTNAISTVKVNDDNMRSVLSPSQLLEGRVSGVNVSTSSGNLGSSERISIRGASSLSAGNEPLYVIDGVPITNTSSSIYNLGESMSALATLNLSDIESVDILKDAASAAIYGSRATNGVIVITTRSGKEGRSDFKVNASYGFSQFANKNKIKLSDSRLWLQVFNEGVDNYNRQEGLQVGDAGYKIHMSNPFYNMPDTDWLSLILQTGSSYKFDASVSGGSKKTTYYVGGSYGAQDGVIKTNSIQKVNLRANITHKVNSWLEVGANNSGNYLRNNQVPGANIGSTVIARAIEQRPFDRPYKPNGDYYVGGTDELRRHNPLQILNEQTAYIDNFRYLGNYFATLKYKDKFTFRTSFNADMSYIYDYVYYNENHPYGTGDGRVVEYNRFISNTVVDNVLNYNDKFGDFEIGGMLGHSFQKINTRTSSIDGRGFASPSFDVISSASEIAGASGYLSEFAMESYFGRASVSYQDKYILNATLRTDGSSKFAPENRWGWFPSISLGWNMSNEEFFANEDIDFKLRASYGKTGNQEGIGRYDYLSAMQGGLDYGLESGIAVTRFGNSDLTWETADQYDLGFDLGLLRGKINILLDVYLKNTNNLLYDMPVHSTTGVTEITSNIGSMRNKGIEFAINTHFNIGEVGWKSQFNISSNKNELTSLLGDDNPIAIGSNRALQVGEEMGAFYLYEMEGIYQYDGEVPQAQYDLGVRAGDVKWKDVDGNGIINDNDRVVTGSSNPDFSGGWNNSFMYKNFQLDVFFTYMYGNDVYAAWKANGTGRIGYTNANLEEIVSNRWTGPGTSNKYPRSINGYTHNDKNSTRWLEDGSFIRLRTLTLSYNFQSKLLERINIKALRLYAQGDNLFLLTNYSGWDPEVSTNMDPRYFGVDNFSVPQPRTITFGANITF